MNCAFMCTTVQCCTVSQRKLPLTKLDQANNNDLSHKNSVADDTVVP